MDANSAPSEVPDKAPQRKGGFIPRMREPLPGAAHRPAWLTDAALLEYVAAFEPHGFRGPVNFYRNFDRNFELTGTDEYTRLLSKDKLTIPVQMMIGEHDVVLALSGWFVLASKCPACCWGPALQRWGLTRMLTAGGGVDPRWLRDVVVLRGAEHWITETHPDQVSAFLSRLLVFGGGVLPKGTGRSFE